jgi:hypothetical protein
MTIRRFGTLAFEPPSGWKERQIVIFEGPTYGAVPTTIVITREDREANETMEAYALQNLMLLSKTLDGFKLIETSDLKVGGRRAKKVRYVSTTARGELEQTLVYVDAPDGVTITIAYSAAPGGAGASLATLERLLESAAFLHAAKASPPPPFDFVAPQLVPMPGASRRA